VNNLFAITEPIDRKIIARIKSATMLARVALRIWFLARVLHFAGNKLGLPRRMAEGELLRKKYAGLANVIPDNPEDTGYTGDHDLLTWLKYRRQLTDEATLILAESKQLYEKLVDVVSGLIESTDSIKVVFNFGVCYAHVDSILAKAYPHIQFVGCDRSSFTKAMNEVEFSEIPNLKFLSGDFFTHVNETSYRSGVFLHSRIACLFGRPLVEKIYNKAFESGFEYVAGFEQFGLSRETFKPFTFSLEQTDSVWFRAQMFIHNYPALLLKTGYRVERFEIFKPTQHHPDFRMVAFVARRDPSLHEA